jgi:small-conductance mechanosensitive channel
VGDSVAVAGIEGKIEAIRLRGTTIRTFDGTTVIIPNTQMIGERLTSLSYGLHTARMQVDVGVSYDADPHEVERVLLEVARADKRVLEDPAPFVRFNAFGASSLDFLMRCYTHEVSDRFNIASQLKVAVFEALKKNGIEIPFPQQDVHFRTGVQVAGPPSPERGPPSA